MMVQVRKKILVVSMVVGVLLGLCAEVSAYPGAPLKGEDGSIRFTDLAGREVVLDGPAKRVFLGFYAECFMAVNGGIENLAAISKGEWADFFNAQYSAYEAALPGLKNVIDTGSIYKGSFSMETALSAAPDVAILAPFQFETLGENVATLERNGIKVVVIDYNAQKVERHVQSTLILGAVTGKDERARRLAGEYANAVEEVRRRVEHLTETERRRVYVELGNLGASEYGNSYGDFLWGALVMLAGGNNIAYGRVQSYGALSPEFILASDPETIILAGSQWVNDTGNRVRMGFGVEPREAHERMRPYLGRPGWNRLSAVKNGEIFAVDHAGLRSIYDYVYLQYIAKALYPDLFADIDPQRSIVTFYEEYLPVSAEGCFMTKYAE